MSELVADLLAGNHSALARVITKIENRSPGYRALVSALHEHTGNAEVVGVIAIDPSSPYTGGAVLGDRIRMASNAGDMDVFFRSMSARGSLGGLSTATTDAVTALDAFGKDYVVVETVGAGQNEVDIVKTADTVAVLVPPGSGDDVQMLKAGILEIGDVFVVNKADLDGADRTVQQLREMLQGRGTAGHHGASGTGMAAVTAGGEGTDDADAWEPPIVETVASRGDGVADFLAALADHGDYLDRTGRRDEQARKRFAAEIRTLLREDANRLVAAELDRQGGLDGHVDAVTSRETDPYTVVEGILGPLRNCLDEE